MLDSGELEVQEFKLSFNRRGYWRRVSSAMINFGCGSYKGKRLLPRLRSPTRALARLPRARRLPKGSSDWQSSSVGAGLYKTYTLRFTEKELAQNWAMLVNYRDKAVSEGATA